MTETLNTFDYLKRTVMSFVILAVVTFSALCVSNHSFAAEFIGVDFVAEKTTPAQQP